MVKKLFNLLLLTCIGYGMFKKHATMNNECSLLNGLITVSIKHIEYHVMRKFCDKNKTQNLSSLSFLRMNSDKTSTYRPINITFSQYLLS